MELNPERRPTWAEIDLDNLAFNAASVRDFIGRDVRCMAVIKADAYGHGAICCGRRLQTEGVDSFAVATIEEGVELRNAGISVPILILGGWWPGQIDLGIANGLTPAVFTLEQARAINTRALERDLIVDVHLKFDTGMGRVGFRHDDASDIARAVIALANLRVDGLMTHFAAADDLESSFTAEQIKRFDVVREAFRSVGITPTNIDLANSPGAVAHPESRSNLVRLGGVLYGLGGDVLPGGIVKPELRPVMSVRTRVAQIKRVPNGETVGYSRTFTTRRDSLIATIPIGYHDGFRRGLSNIGSVIVNGLLAPVIGRISMDWTTIDVTDLHSVNVGDRVTIIGSDGQHQIKSEDIARELGTISYEITCGISSRVPRIFIGNQ